MGGQRTQQCLSAPRSVLRGSYPRSPLGGDLAHLVEQRWLLSPPRSRRCSFFVRCVGQVLGSELPRGEVLEEGLCPQGNQDETSHHVQTPAQRSAESPADHQSERTQRGRGQTDGGER